MNQQSWLYSDSFLKRAFAIWGHYMVANLIIGVCVMAIGLLIAITFGSALAPVSTTTSSNGAAMDVDVDLESALD